MDQVKLKNDALLKLNLPINIELGMIKHLEIQIPWFNIGSSPVELKIQGLNLIVSPQKKSDWQIIDIFDQGYLENKLSQLIVELKSKLSQEDNQGYFERLAAKVVDNIQIKIEDVHFRFEDHFSGDQSYTFGVVMNLLEVSTTNENWIPRYIDRTQSGQNKNLYKIAKIEGFGIYLNPNDAIIIHQQTQTQGNRIQMMDAVMQSQNQLLRFILKPMNLKLKLEYQTKLQKKVNVTLNLDRLQFSLLQPQLKCMIKQYEIINEYHKFQNDLMKTVKFKYLRPLSDSVTPANARQWWKYAYLCIKKSNRSKKGSIKEFNIPKQQLKKYETDFVKLVAKYSQNRNSVKWKREEQAIFRHILMAIDFSIIKQWTQIYLKPTIEKENTEQKSQVSFTQWLLYGKTSKPSEILEESSDIYMNQDELKELEKEVEKELQYEVNSKQTAINLNIVIKESSIEMGIIKDSSNDQNLVEGISVFAIETCLSYKQIPQQDFSFDMQGSISDFGVDLFTLDQTIDEIIDRQPVIISNKKIFPQSLEEQWRIRIRKKPDDHRNIENDIELLANPLVLLYNKEFIKRATLISRLGFNENIQNSAIDTLEDWREATSSQIYSIIYKKANRLRINIASPVLIVPLSGDSNKESPIWVFRLGDLQVISQENTMNTSVVDYEKYEILLDSIRMQYYLTFESWQNKLENMRNFRDKTIVKEKNDLIFSVLEDCWMRFQICIKQKKAGMLMLTLDQKKDHDLKPKVILSGSASEIKINLSHSIYNKLVNIDKIFDMSQDVDLNKPREEMLIQTKQQVLKNAKKIGQLQKRLDPARIWETYFCILSGGYLYFYKDSQQIMPSSYFYIKNCEIEENNKDLALPNNIYLKNRFGECCLALSNLNHFNDWNNKIRSRLYEIKQEEDINNNESRFADQILQPQANRKKVINHDAIQFQFDLYIPAIKANLVDELRFYQDWIMIQLSKMKISNAQRKTQNDISFEVSQFQLIDLTMIVNSNLISQRRFVDQPSQNNEALLSDNALDIQIVQLKKSNPNYANVDQETDISINNLVVKMQPVTINDVLKFLNNTKPDKSFNLMKNEERINGDQSASIVSEDLKSEGGSRNSQISLDHNHASCGTIKETYHQLNIVVNNISITMLHQEYHMDLFRMDSSQIKYSHTFKYDHFIVDLNMIDLTLFDLTGYPYTLDPQKFHENPNLYRQTEREFLTIKNLNGGNYKYPMNYYYESYQSPKCDLKKEGFKSKMLVVVKTIRMEYFQQSFMRFYSYFFDQMLPSVFEVDPYHDPQAQFLLLKSRKTIKIDTIKTLKNFNQETEIIEMNIKVEDISIEVPERPNSNNYLNLYVQELSCTNQLIYKGGRLSLNPNQKLHVESFKINFEKILILFGESYRITQQAFNAKMVFETLSFSKLIQRIDPQILDKSSHLLFDMDPVQLSMPQDIYTNILRCMDLNINFQDMMEKSYFFVKYINIQEFNKQQIDVISMKIKMRFQALYFKMFHIDGQFLSELQLHNLRMGLTNFTDQSSKRRFKIENFFISEQETKIFENQPSLLSQSQLLQESQNRRRKFDDFVIQPLAEKDAAPIFFMEVKGDQPKQRKQIQNQLFVIFNQNSLGDKEIKIDIQGLRITIKPHIFLMMFYFFQNSFPIYDQNSNDKPSSYNFDPEDKPRMNLSCEIQDSLICLQNKPGLKTIACQGKFKFEMISENIQKRKMQLMRASEQIEFNDEVFDEDFDAEKQFEINQGQIENKYIYRMKVLIKDLCPFICSLSQLNNNINFSKIKKRQLLSPFNLQYRTDYELVMKDLPRNRKSQGIDELLAMEFGINVNSLIKVQKIKMKMSLQDMHLFFLIIKFANENVSKEYLNKLEKLEKFTKDNNENIKESRFSRTKTIKEDFGLLMPKQMKREQLQPIIDVNEVDEENKDDFDDLFGIKIQKYNESFYKSCKLVYHCSSKTFISYFLKTNSLVKSQTI